MKCPLSQKLIKIKKIWFGKTQGEEKCPNPQSVRKRKKKDTRVTGCIISLFSTCCVVSRCWVLRSRRFRFPGSDPTPLINWGRGRTGVVQRGYWGWTMTLAGPALTPRRRGKDPVPPALILISSTLCILAPYLACSLAGDCDAAIESR